MASRVKDPPSLPLGTLYFFFLFRLCLFVPVGEQGTFGMNRVPLRSYSCVSRLPFGKRRYRGGVVSPASVNKSRRVFSGWIDIYTFTTTPMIVGGIGSSAEVGRPRGETFPLRFGVEGKENLPSDGALPFDVDHGRGHSTRRTG